MREGEREGGGCRRQNDTKKTLKIQRQHMWKGCGSIHGAHMEMEMATLDYIYTIH